MIAKEKEKTKLGQVLEQRQAKRAEALAPVQEKIDQITQLIKEGDTRQAYRIFEELPILDQLAISLTPGVGDALAVYETGEFGTRAGERFEQDDILGGIGNVALSGLSAASTIPFFGAIPTVAKSLTKVAKVADDIPSGGGGSLVEKAPNEYRGAKPDNVTIGLKSPYLEALRKMNPTKERELKSLVTRLIKDNPSKVGELRALDVIEDIKPGKFSGDRIVLTTEIQKYFPNPNKVTAGGLDLYMSAKMGDALTMRRPPSGGTINKSAGLATSNSYERLYGVRGLELKKTNDHTSRFFDEKNPDNTIAFDNVERDGNILRVNRLQSDYGEELSKATKKRKQLGFKSSNPFTMPQVVIPPEIDKITKQLKELVQEKNKLANEYNKNDIGYVFGADDLPIARVNPLDEKSFKKGQKASYDFSERFVKNQRAIGDAKGKINAILKQSNPDLFNAGYFKDIQLDDYLDLPKYKKMVLDRETFYGGGARRDGSLYNIELDPEYYGGTSTTSFSALPSSNIDNIDDQIAKLNLGDSDLVYKKDPFREGMTSRTHVFPIRAMVNEAAQATDAKTLEIPVGRLRKSGEIAGGGDSAATIFKYYDDMYDELNKISNELNLPTGSVMKIEDFTETLRVKDPVTGLNMDKDFDLDTIKLDLDAIRDALAEGKQISAFKRGGPVDIDSLLNNL